MDNATAIKARAISWARHQQRWWGKWHLYLGIIAGLVLSITGITGSILAFRNEIDQALNPDLFRVQASGKRLTFEEVYPQVQQHYPYLDIQYIYRTDTSAAASYAVHDGKTGREYYIHPYTGRLIRDRGETEYFTGFILQVHRSLLIPVAGRYLAGLSALVMLIMTITGLRLWWPANRRKLKPAFTIQCNSGFKRIIYDLHKTIGIYAAPFIGMSSVTGLSISFGFVVLPLLFILNGQSPAALFRIFKPASAYVHHRAPLPLHTIIQLAGKAMPGLDIEAVGAPKDSVGVYMINGLLKGTSNTGTRVIANFDQYTGKMLSSTERDMPFVSHAYFTWVQAIHFGTFGGIVPRLLLLLAGLVPVTLFTTGLIIWWPRCKKQPANNIRERKSSAPTLRNGPYFIQQFKKGTAYAGRVLVAGSLLAGLYGATGGTVAAPVVFTIIVIAALSMANFMVALPVGILHLFAAVFKKGNKALPRYFTWSLSFMLLASVCAIILMKCFPAILS